MRLIRYCVAFFAALSFFVAAPSSADVIYQFNGVCDTYSNPPVGSPPEPVPCDTLADPSFELILVMDPAYESVCTARSPHSRKASRTTSVSLSLKGCPRCRY